MRRPASARASERALRGASQVRSGACLATSLTGHYGASGVVVGVIAWELRLHGCTSLKQKRAVLRSLKDRLRGRHNLAVAETDHQDVWQMAELCAATVSSDRRRVQEVLSRADSLVASDARVSIVDSETIYY